MNDFFLPDSSQKTISIPVKINQSKVECLYGGDLSSIKDGTCATLILSKNSISDDEFSSMISDEKEVELLPSESVLLAKFSDKDTHLLDKPTRNYLLNVKENYIKDNNDIPHLMLTGFFAEIMLVESMRLFTRGTKKSKLEPCKCIIPMLAGKEAISINHAYTLISTILEPSRISHNGNVFEKVFFLTGNNKWKQLDYFRRYYESIDVLKFKFHFHNSKKKET